MNYSCYPAFQEKGAARPWTPLRAKQLSTLLPWKKKKHCRQLLVAIDKKGKTHFKRNLEKWLALKELQNIVLWESALQKEWLPKDINSFPWLPGPLQRFWRVATWERGLLQLRSAGCWRRQRTNRPGVAGAVLQTPLLLNYVSTIKEGEIFFVSSFYH